MEREKIKEVELKVMKFGGGCLKNWDNFLQVAGIIEAEGDQTAVVVSAASGITNLLLEGINEVIQLEKNAPGVTEAFREKYMQIAGEAIKNEQIKHRIIRDIKVRMKKLEQLFYGISYTEEITDSVKALILSYGERFSALILSGVLNSLGREAVALESDKIGIVTDESFENATALLSEVRRNLAQNVLPLIKRKVIPVITGYFGCTRDGRVTTFGRNGSDYSAAVVAYGMEASSLEIWKDVDGFMTADPDVVKGARRVDRLSYYEAAELSYFGARIMHPRTVEPLVQAKIQVEIRNLEKTESKGTEILPGSYERKGVIKSVTYNTNIVVLRIHGPGVGYKPGIIAEIGRVLSDKKINIYSVITSQTCINLLIDKKDVQKGYESIQRLSGGVIERVDLRDNIALIAVVGEGLLKRRGVAARVFSAVAEKEINVEMISSGASDVSYYFIIEERDVTKAVMAIHDEFFG